uniref:Uncharacterized protein n=1 Tax=Arion vulgaris TaxID=1028688 RepID=A0A0B6YUJ1_9EUPU
MLREGLLPLSSVSLTIQVSFLRLQRCLSNETTLKRKQYGPQYDEEKTVKLIQETTLNV